jgi:hypothetical protein
MIIDAGDNILTLRDEQEFPETNIFGRLCSPERKQPRLLLLNFCRVKFGRRLPLKLAFAAKPVPEKLRLIVENVAGKIYYKPIKLLLLILPSIDEKWGEPRKRRLNAELLWPDRSAGELYAECVQAGNLAAFGSEWYEDDG